MKSWIRYTAIGFLVFSLTACNAEPEVSVDNEVKDGDAAGIELTTQVNGVFKGFEGDDQKKVIIDYEGEVKTYEVAEDASGDFDIIKENDNIAFSTKMIDGKEMIETLRLN
jgi:hypothetical protein